MSQTELNTNKSSLLESFDLFGVPITIRYKQKEKHQTHFGAAISIAIIIILLIQLQDLLSDLVNYKNYNVIFQENIVEIPRKFEINPQSFTFIFGLQDTKLKQILNEAIYTVEGQFLSTIKKFNDTSQQYEFVTESIPFKPEVCTEKHFQVEGAIDYFQKLPYHYLYCLPLGFNMTLEGQFGAAIYKRFRLILRYCEGDTCLPLDQVKKTLEYCNLQVYYVNKAVQPTDRQNPFKPFGQSIFWQSGYSIMKNVNIYFRNNNLESDEGIFQSEKVYHSSLSYSFEREQIINQVDRKMFDVFVNLEKNKESQYFRKYQKLSQGLSQLGGLFNFLFSLGCLICHPVSRLLLQHKLLNSVFSFQKKDQLTQQKGVLSHTAQQELLLQLNNFTSPFQMTESKILETETDENNKVLKDRKDQKDQRITLYNSNQDNLKQNADQKLTNNSNINLGQLIKQQTEVLNDDLKLKKEENTKSLFHFNTEPIQEEIEEVTEKVQRKKRTTSVSKKSTKLITKLENELNPNVFQTSIDKIKIKIKDVLLSIVSMKLKFLPFIKPTPKSKMISYSFQNLNNHIDMSQIITKLIEIEKLKQLLLNEDQVKLFEFIPQPNMNEEEFKVEKEPQLYNSSILNSGILYYDKRSISEKARDAQLAFNRIFNNSIENISNIDKKLLTLLDPKVQAVFSQVSNQVQRNLQQPILTSKSKTFFNTRQSFSIFKTSPQEKSSIKRQLNFNISDFKDNQDIVYGHKGNTDCDKDTEQLPV